jgi:hypothetical protein
MCMHAHFSDLFLSEFSRMSLFVVFASVCLQLSFPMTVHAVDAYVCIHVCMHVCVCVSLCLCVTSCMCTAFGQRNPCV